MKELAWAKDCQKVLIKADSTKNGLKFEGNDFLNAGGDDDEEGQEVDLSTNAQKKGKDAFLIISRYQETPDQDVAPDKKDDDGFEEFSPLSKSEA